MRPFFYSTLLICAATFCLSAQVRPSVIYVPPQQQPPVAPTGPTGPTGPAAATGPTGAPAPAPAAQPPSPQVNVRPLSDTEPFAIPNGSLTEMIDILARRLKINYILDPRVKGTVTIYTYGEMKQVDLMQLLQTILRVNGAAMVQVGNLYRIVPIATVANLPTSPVMNADPKTLPDDERMVLNLIFLKYTTATEMETLLTPFMGEGATHSTYPAANLLIVEDNSRSMRRLMELVQLFDADTFAGQRVKLFEIENSRPSDLQKELESVFKSYALSEKNAAVKFIPVDRINTLIAVASNPGIFDEVQKWITKLDIPEKLTAGTTTVWTYRMKYGRAEIVAMAIMALFSGNPMALMSLASSMNNGMVQAGMGYNGTGYGMGMGMGMGGYSPYGSGGYNPYGGGGYSPYGNLYGGGGGYGSYGYGPNAVSNPAVPLQSTASATGATGPQGAGQTGSYLSPNTYGGMGYPPGAPHVVPNPFDNTLLVQGSPQDIEQIKQLLTQLDVAPRQVLIEAKIYEVELDNALSAGVQSYLQKVNSNAATGASGSTGSTGSTGLSPSTALAAAAGSLTGGLSLTAGALVLNSHELIGVLNTNELRNRTRVISAPSIIATDSIPATINVGTQVPVLTSQGLVPGVQNGGSSVFANTVSNQSTGVTLSIVAHVNSSGIVTMIIDQQVSAPISPGSGSAIQSPSFSNRSVSTQVTVQDGEMIAIGGIIMENRGETTAGVPVLNRVPVLGALFGSKNYTSQRTELIIFLTPRVIYDTNQIVDATEEIRNSLKHLNKLMKNQ